MFRLGVTSSAYASSSGMHVNKLVSWKHRVIRSISVCRSRSVGFRTRKTNTAKRAHTHCQIECVDIESATVEGRHYLPVKEFNENATYVLHPIL